MYLLESKTSVDRKASTNNERQNNGKLMVKMRQHYTKECKTLLNFDKRDVGTTHYRHSNSCDLT